MKKLFFLVIGLTVLIYADTPWVPNVRVSIDEPWDTLNQGESCFAIYGDTIVSICNTAERGQVPVAPYAYSFNAGQTFTQIPFTDLSGGTWHTDPVICFDDSGHVHMLIQFSLEMLKHYLSRDGGQTWEDTSTVTNSYGVDKPWMVVNGSDIYIAWQQTSGQTGIRFAKSTNYGATWNLSLIWSRTGIAALCMDEYDILHLALVAWGAGRVYYKRSTNYGQTWSSETYLSDFTYSSSYGDRAPINSITAKDNVVFITWVDQTFGTWDIRAVRSTDGGSTWSSPYVINDITPGGQCKCWVLFDGSGGLHLTYYHTPDWPTNPSSLFSFRYQYSSDAGVTFNPGIRVSDTSVTSLDDFIGEYHITQADDAYLYAIWTDGRNGDYNDLYFSKALLLDLRVAEEDRDEQIVNRILAVPTIWNSKVLMRVQPYASPLEINAYDISGRLVKHIYAGRVSSPMLIQLDHNDFPQGIIFVRLHSKDISEVCKIVNLK